MSLPQDLLEQARDLTHRERTRPRQASLRRAVSAICYALFHLLVTETARLFVSDPTIQAQVNRTLNHSDMLKVSRAFVAGKLPKALTAATSGLAVEVELKRIAEIFVTLQQARHEADYNLIKRFSRGEVGGLLEDVERAFLDWQTIRKRDHARLYLACFLLWDRWDKER